MTLQPAKPGGWNEEDLLQSDEMNALQAELIKAIDGQDGGTYVLEAVLEFQGADIRIANDLEVLATGRINVNAGGSVNVDAGALINVAGDVDLVSGANLDVEAGAELDVHGALDIESAGTLNVRSGGNLIVELGGDIEVEDGGDINVQNGGDIDVLSGGGIRVQSGGDLQIDGDATVGVGGTLLMGGTMNVQGDINVTGADINLNISSAINVANGADINVESSGDVNVEPGGQINVEGQVRAHGGGTIDVEASSTLNVKSGGQLNTEAGGIVQLDEGSDLTIDDASETFRLALHPSYNQLVGGALAWEPTGSMTWTQADTAAAWILMIPIRLRPGDSITSITMRLNGGAGAGHAGGGIDALTRPTITIVSVDTDGNLTSHAMRVDNAASQAAYDVAHNVTLTAGSVSSGAMPVVLGNDPYYVLITGEAGADAIDDTLALLSISGVAIARSIRPNAMVY